MNLSPAQRRTNLLLFVSLVIFAVTLCAVILLWMRARTKEQGGRVYPAAIYHSRHLSAGQRSAGILPAGSRQKPGKMPSFSIYGNLRNLSAT